MKRIVILLLIITGLYIIFQQSLRFDWFLAGNREGKAAISSDIHVIKVDVSAVNADIIPEDRMNLKAVLDGNGKLTVKEDGDTVVVTVKKKWFDWFDWAPFTKKSLKIYAPESYHENMEIDLGSGNLNYSGKSMKLDELSVGIGSGNMNLNNLTVHHFIHDGSSGNVHINSLTTKTGSFDLSSGNLDIQHYIGKINGDVSSGRAKIQVDKLTDSIDLDLSSGIVDLDLPNNADFNLDGEVSSGTISCDFPLKSKEFNRKSIKGTHGNGEHKINLSVSSGKIDIH
ncbi:DUF4097 family beta strand repeat-containing protein [Neobacillus niacini]|uniref:LiaG family protein n=1 Tax=Neobacillus niacini TaxID=86668 RepID=UPI002862DA5A|nr:DUF4097 family beta strand repeat-containing protein [Neobacillus niacini]MDR6999983.1 lia operon protein LiaG [Neobacillus niacini]